MFESEDITQTNFKRYEGKLWNFHSTHFLYAYSRCGFYFIGAARSKKGPDCKTGNLPGSSASVKDALAEPAKVAVQVEPGVLGLQAVQDKVHPQVFTVFEIYASEETYQHHLKTPHFLKYKMERLKWSNPLS